MTSVFVYGTLKRGLHNHGLLQGSEFVGPARTKAPMKMFSNGGFPVVFLDQKAPICGEVYEVDDRTLERLDHLEGVPWMYLRHETEVELGDTGVFHTCLMYVGNPDNWRNRQMPECPIVGDAFVWEA